MMKQLKYGTACLLLLAAAACGDDSDAYYTAVYPVVRVEAEITLPTPEPDPTDPTQPETKAGENETDPVAERIKAEIEAAAPVKAGGSYVLEFTKYNGGRLWIRQAAEADRVRGVFFKDPARPTSSSTVRNRRWSTPAPSRPTTMRTAVPRPS